MLPKPPREVAPDEAELSPLPLPLLPPPTIVTWENPLRIGDVVVVVLDELDPPLPGEGDGDCKSSPQLAFAFPPPPPLVTVGGD
ncbi:MAG: hypothetical protein JO295_09850 [Verrucomicrobia bacterium]|nr:hypothetical protein [Verrucomicrobiota bacterium]